MKDRIDQARLGAPVSHAPALYTPPAAERNSAFWRINGHRARILIWTAEEWAALADRPPDAQYYPCGIWCALRIDPVE